MIWQNPWAWLGLLTLAIPLLVHLLARRTARVHRFPTLRFLATSPLLATRRTKLTDLLLLTLRCAILLAAVAALAQPYLLSPERTARNARAVTRVIVADTSASMQRVSQDGATARAAAGRAADSASANAASTIIETDMLPEALRGAAAWLALQPGRPELLVLSDFQYGTLDSLDVAALPPQIRVRLQRIATTADATTGEHVVPHGAVETVARIALTDEASDIAWSERLATPAASGVAIDGNDSLTITPALRAAQYFGARQVPAARPITVLLPAEAQADASQNGALTAPWMSNVLTQLTRDPLLSVYPPRGNRPLLNATAVSANGADRLVLSPNFAAEERTAATAALLVALGNATSIAPPSSELEPRVISDAELNRWSRAPDMAARRDKHAGNESDGRWLWLIALLLLGVETIMRRRAMQDTP